MKRLILIITLATLAVSTGGCKKFLDTIPDNRTQVDNVEKVEKLLVNAYPRRTYAGILEPRCDGMTSFGSKFDGSQQTESYEHMRAGFYWMPQVPVDYDDTYERFWEDCYRAISYCNFALQAIEQYKDQWTEAQVSHLRAEAHVSRAYHHFLMLCLFTNMFQEGREAQNMGIPYVTETEDDVFKQYERNTVAYVLDRIKEDLGYNSSTGWFDTLELLSSGSAYEVPEFRFTRNAGYAFAVRFCLFTKDYQGVLNYCSKLGGLLPTATTWVNGTKNDFDGKLEKYVNPDDNAYKQVTSILLAWQPFKAIGTDLYQPGLYFSDPKNSSFLLSTEVESIVFRSTIGTLLTSYNYSFDALSRITAKNCTGADWALPVLQFSNDPTGFVVKYYEDMLLINESAGIGYVHVKANLFRLEEVLLARAEAKVMLGGEANIQSALDDLNMYAATKINNYNYENRRLSKTKIRDYYTSELGAVESFVNNEFNRETFSHLSGNELTVTQSLLLAIMDFRRTEFIYEGMRYFDILRWNMIVEHTNNVTSESHKLYPDDDNRILQIPYSAVLNGLELNPLRNIRDPWPGIIYE